MYLLFCYLCSCFISYLIIKHQFYKSTEDLPECDFPLIKTECVLFIVSLFWPIFYIKSVIFDQDKEKE